MDGKKRACWLSLALTFLFLSAGGADASHILGLLHREPDGYSPCHYRFPTLWRVKAHCFGVNGMPVSVFPPGEEETVIEAVEEAPAPSPSPVAPKATTSEPKKDK
jgi:hypothetical protein